MSQPRTPDGRLLVVALEDAEVDRLIDHVEWSGCRVGELSGQ
jgi:hypothetical protein